VPPSPANYAQRSGRAGRSGQGAMVITYAEAGSGHNRWRTLYTDAVNQKTEAQPIIDRATAGNETARDRDAAGRLLREAQHQIDILVGQDRSSKSNSQFEFYPYRYFASEGFLPGFKFPRLSVFAYIPTGKDGGVYISRPRHLAIREMAPQNILYYEGSKFKIDRTKRYAQGIDRRYKELVICDRCGYFHTTPVDVCENCGFL
jgi:hypothetical protein